MTACSSGSVDQPIDNLADARTSDGASTDSSSAACMGKAAQPADATWKVGGRDVFVHVPAGYDPATPNPIVLGIHGLSSNGPDQARISHMIAASDARGFIAVHPDGTGSPKGWNGGDCCNPAASSNVDDTAFIASVLDEVDSRLCVDRDRVFAIGMSNGAFLAHRLGCELSDRIAAIGTVSGVLGIETCNPMRPVPVFHVHGTSDFVIPYGGGGVNGNISVADSITGWATRNHCSGSPVTTFDDGDATCTTRGGCDGNADVVLCTIDGGGHQWPGGENIGLLNGKKSDDLDATDAAWQFFAAHPRAVE
jgi:polyhydroxybutyrate depolymerase